MNWMRNLCALVIAGSALSQSAFGALHDRGGGLLYDDVLNVTWLQDANYAKTSGYDADGRMHWSAANSWASNLVYHDNVRNMDYSDWRLARTGPANGVSWDYRFTNDGSADFGYNITSPNSELSYMYYVNLGLKGYFSPTGVFQPDYGISGNGNTGGQVDAGLVKNLQGGMYWSGTAYAPYPANLAWEFETTWGHQHYAGQSDSDLFAWAVRPGDVGSVGGGGSAAAIPEPETYAMLLAGLGVLAFVARGNRRFSAQPSILRATPSPQ